MAYFEGHRTLLFIHDTNLRGTICISVLPMPNFGVGTCPPRHPPVIYAHAFSHIVFCVDLLLGDGDVCGGVDRCWSHDSSAVNTSLCYYPCSASPSTSSASAPRPVREICTAHLDRAPSVHSVTRRPSTRPRLRVDGVSPVEGRREASASSLDASSKASRPRCPPVFCLIGVVAAVLLAAAAHYDSDRAVLRVPVDDDREFPRDAGEFPLPVVNSVVSGLDAAAVSCSSHSCTSVSYCCRRLTNRTIKS